MANIKKRREALRKLGTNEKQGLTEKEVKRKTRKIREK